MPSKKNMMKKNLENLHLKERINYGYRKVIIMMLVSGLFSIVVIGMLFANTMHYVQNVTVADRAVKICRINVNSSAPGCGEKHSANRKAAGGLLPPASAWLQCAQWEACYPGAKPSACHANP